MSKRLATDARLTEQKDDRPLPHQIRRPRLTERERSFQKVEATEEKALQTKGAESREPYRKCYYPSCNYWHPPVCQDYKSETGCTYGNKCFFRHVEAEEKPSNKSKKGGAKGSVALLRSLYKWVVCLKSLIRETLSTERRKIGIKSRRQILQGHVAPKKNSGKKGSLWREIIQKCEPHERSLCAPKFNERSQEERCTKKDAPAE